MNLLAPPASSRSFSLKSMKWDQPLRLTILLWLAFVGVTGCTQDFRVRRAASAASTASTSSTSPNAHHLLALCGNALVTARDHTMRAPVDPGRTLVVTLKRGSSPGGVDPSDCVALEPADDFVVDHVDHLSRTSGEGVPLVATLRSLLPVNSPGVVAARPTSGVRRALTAVASVDPRGTRAVTFRLYDPRTSLRPLAADYTTPLALNLARFPARNAGDCAA